MQRSRAPDAPGVAAALDARATILARGPVPPTSRATTSTTPCPCARIQLLRGSQGRAELLGRASALQRGDWLQLLQAARRACRPAQDAPPTDPAAIAERKRHQACFKVKQGELSRAREVLTTCDLALGTEATWAALTDPVPSPGTAHRDRPGRATPPA